MIEMPVRPILGIIPSGHNNNGAGLLTPLRVGTIVTMISKMTLGAWPLGDLCIGGV